MFTRDGEGYCDMRLLSGSQPEFEAFVERGPVSPGVTPLSRREHRTASA